MSEVIKLPEPDRKGTMSLEQAIISRRSKRQFLGVPLSLEQIGQLLWAAQGKQQGGKFRNIPSAGATYPLEIFAVSKNGLFHYLPEKHAIEELSKEDVRDKIGFAAWGQKFVTDAPLTIVIAAEFSRTTGRYGERGIRYVHVEAGHAAQNIHLQAESLGLGSVSVGAFDDGAISEVLSLPENIEPVDMVTVGHCRDAHSSREQ
ncbi:MAG: SagB/ThcOx family dehydrogenase [Sedimentisphaerales bacterium]